MELITWGRNHYPGLCHVMRCELTTSRDGNLGLGSRYRLLLVLQGSGLLGLGGRTYPVVAPAVYCLNETDELHLGACADLETRAVYFNPDIVNNRFTFERLARPELLQGSDHQDLWCLQPFRERDPSYYGCIPLDAAAARHLSAMLEQTDGILRDQSDEYWPCRSRSGLMELLFLVSRLRRASSAEAALPESAIDGELRPVVAYLHTHYRDKIKLDELAKRFHTNRTTLNARFRASAGQSVMAYLGAVRMQIAASLLRNTLLPTDEILERIGMKDDAHFIRSFRKHAGCTPAEYRGSHCWLLDAK